MASYQAVYDYNTDLKNVINYAEEYPTSAGNYNIYNNISDMDRKIKKYLKEVSTVIETEKKYGLNKSSFSIAGVDVTASSIKTITEKANDLEARWKKIKAKIKKAALKERVDILTQIIYSCRREKYSEFPLGLLLTEEERRHNSKLREKEKEAEGYLEYTQKVLNGMD